MCSSSWLFFQAADTYNLQTHLPDETAEPDPSEDSSSLNDADTVLGSSTDLQNATNDCRTLDGYDSSSTGQKGGNILAG